MKGPSTRAVFLDRDGTIIHNRHYGYDPDALELIDGVVEGLAMLRDEGFRLVIITNQSGVARGYFTEEQLRAVHLRLDEMLAARGIGIDAFYYCPHHVDGVVAEYALACDCRKPNPGMILRACRELGIAPEASWMVGDILDDVEAGRRAGCRAILIDLGTEGTPDRPEREPEFVASDLLHAARYIVEQSRQPSRRKGAAVG